MRNLLIAAAVSLAGYSAAAPALAAHTAAHDTGRTPLARGSTIPVIPPAAYDALSDVYARLGLQGRMLDADEGAFGVRNVRVRQTLAGTRVAQLVRCGSDRLADAGTLDVTLTVVTVLEPSATGITVHTSVTGVGRDQSGSSTSMLCTSTGRLEDEILRGMVEATSGAPR